MQKYELLYILPAKYTEGEIASLKEKITNDLAALGISITRNDVVGKIKLGYAMEHIRYGHYVLVNFEAEPAVIAKINDLLRLSSEVVRHHIVVEEAGIKPIVMLADPEARPERRESVAVPASGTTQEPIANGPTITEEELDKRLDALEQDITKEL